MIVRIRILICFLLCSATLAPRPALALQPHPSAQGFWSPAPAMLAPATSHQAILLHDGRVLVTGGETFLGGDAVPRTQMYDPVAHTWSLAPNMHVGRIAHTMTVLRDGRVLVVGGIGPRLEDLASAEVFDPMTRTWQLLAPLPGTRFSHSASLLPDGRVLIVGGIVDGHISRSTLLFDAIRNQFVPGPRTRVSHALHHVATLHDGRILLVGGYGGGPEIYQPRSTIWSLTAGTPLRRFPVMMALVDGTVLFASGESANTHDLRSARVFDPARSSWSTVAPMHTWRNAAAAVRLSSGEVLVAGGEQVIGRILQSVELYKPISRTWVQGPPLLTPRGGATAVQLQDRTVLVCGGADWTGPLASCEVYHPPEE